MRGRKPIPTAIKALSGNPGRRKLNEYEPRPPIGAKVPRPPASLSADARCIWKRDAAELHAFGVLTNFDLREFAILCELRAELAEVDTEINRTKSKQGRTRYLVKGSKGQILNPLLRMRRDLRASVIRLSAEFGCTPASRSRVVAEPPAGADNEVAANYDL